MTKAAKHKENSKLFVVQRVFSEIREPQLECLDLKRENKTRCG